MLTDQRLEESFWFKSSSSWHKYDHVQRVNFRSPWTQRGGKNNYYFYVDWANRAYWRVSIHPWNRHFQGNESASENSGSLPPAQCFIWLSLASGSFEAVCIIQRSCLWQNWRASATNANWHRPCASKESANKNSLGRVEEKALGSHCSDRRLKACDVRWANFWNGHCLPKEAMGHAQKIQAEQDHNIDHSLHGWSWYSRRQDCNNGWGPSCLYWKLPILEEEVRSRIQPCYF